MSNEIKPMLSETRIYAEMSELAPIIEESLERGVSVTIAIRGRSMLPMLVEGEDSVTLSPIARDIRRNDIILYRRGSGEYVLHRIISEKDGAYTLQGDAQKTPETGVLREDIIAVVSSYTKRGKEKSLGSLSYKLYCARLAFCRFGRSLCRATRRFFGKIYRRLFRKKNSK